MNDVIIIGAGPAGLTTAIYAARGGKSVLVIGDKFDSQLATCGRIENYPGFEGEGMDLAIKMEEQAKEWGTEVVTSRVTGLSKEGEIFKAKTQDELYEGRVLVIATGAHPRRLDIPGEEKLLHRGVSYCAVCDGAFFRERNVFVVGYGNGAAKAAYYLSTFSNVKVLCTKKRLRAEAIYLKELDERGVKVLVGVEPIDVFGEELLEGIRYSFEGQEISEKVDGIFVEAGTLPNNDLAADLGLELDDKGFIKVDSACRTSMDMVFACGDIIGGVRQVASAVGEGSIVGIGVNSLVNFNI
ncbi:MAG: thioredoxin reductase [Candidatus Syntrophoarchaeum sp. GoM_oil]|nr:MAG: thioredoxin reductase [Candidatus Syntrophoarchaeum sp. GoM_oil]